MVVGVAFLVVDTALWMWQMRRLALANPESRLPYLGWPPNKPSYFMVITVLGAALMGAGAALVAERADGYIKVWLFVICLILVVGVGVLPPMVTHNRSLPH